MGPETRTLQSQYILGTFSLQECLESLKVDND